MALSFILNRDHIQDSDFSSNYHDLALEARTQINRTNLTRLGNERRVGARSHPAAAGVLARVVRDASG